MQTEYSIVSKQAVTVFSVRDKKERHKEIIILNGNNSKKAEMLLMYKTTIRDNARTFKY